MSAGSDRGSTLVRRKLMGQALFGLVALAATMGACVFLPAGTMRYVEGWASLPIFSSASLAITLYLAASDPELLARRIEVPAHVGAANAGALNPHVW